MHYDRPANAEDVANVLEELLGRAVTKEEYDLIDDEFDEPDHSIFQLVFALVTHHRQTPPSEYHLVDEEVELALDPVLNG